MYLVLFLMCLSSYVARAEVLDAFKAGNFTTQVRNVANDPSGNLYAIGSYLEEQTTSPGYHWIVRKGHGGGSTWSTIDDYRYEAGVPTQGSGIATDSMGNVYATGVAQSSKYMRWITKKSSDGGRTWKIVDEVDDAYGFRIKSSTDGTIYAMSLGGIFGLGQVRVSSDSGFTWVPLPPLPSGKLQFTDLDVDPEKNVYVVGSETKILSEGSRSLWEVYKFSPKTRKWAQIDEFHIAGWHMTHPHAIKVVENGDIYVGGSFGTPNTHKALSCWGIRKSSDAGQTWQTSDQCQEPTLARNMVNGFCSNGEGSVYAVGVSHPPLETAIVKQTTDGGKTWKFRDEFTRYHNNDNMSCLNDPRGNILVGGNSYGSVDGSYDTGSWLIRKMDF